MPKATGKNVNMWSGKAQSRLLSLISNAIPGYSLQSIVDVGANIGQTCVPLAQALPKSKIIAFEPVPATFAELKINTAPFENITIVNAALGARQGEARMTAIGTSDVNRIIALEDDLGHETIKVNITTGREIFDTYGLDRLSFLKIDAEGHDMHVLDGFLEVLPLIDFIKVEAGMNLYNRTHVPFIDFFQALTRRDFLLFHILEQKMEFKLSGRPVLRRSNPVFINKRFANLSGIF